MAIILQGSGTQLVNQTLSGSGIPLIVEKCITFVEAHGMTTLSSLDKQKTNVTGWTDR